MQSKALSFKKVQEIVMTVKQAYVAQTPDFFIPDDMADNEDNATALLYAFSRQIPDGHVHFSWDLALPMALIYRRGKLFIRRCLTELRYPCEQPIQAVDYTFRGKKYFNADPNEWLDSFLPADPFGPASAVGTDAHRAFVCETMRNLPDCPRLIPLPSGFRIGNIKYFFPIIDLRHLDPYDAPKYVVDECGRKVRKWLPEPMPRYHLSLTSPHDRNVEASFSKDSGVLKLRLPTFTVDCDTDDYLEESMTYIIRKLHEEKCGFDAVTHVTVDLSGNGGGDTNMATYFFHFITGIKVGALVKEINLHQVVLDRANDPNPPDPSDVGAYVRHMQQMHNKDGHRILDVSRRMTLCTFTLPNVESVEIVHNVHTYSAAHVLMTLFEISKWKPGHVRIVSADGVPSEKCMYTNVGLLFENDGFQFSVPISRTVSYIVDGKLINASPKYFMP